MRAVHYVVLAIIVAVVAAVALGAAGYFSGVYNGTFGFTNDTNQTTLLQPSVEVESQTMTDSSMLVNRVYLDRPGFVVVHENLNGTAGAALGSSDIINGEQTNLMIQLDVEQPDEVVVQPVMVMLHYDTNGNGEFDESDQMVMLEGGLEFKMVLLTLGYSATDNTTNTTGNATVQ